MKQLLLAPQLNQGEGYTHVWTATKQPTPSDMASILYQQQTIVDSSTVPYIFEGEMEPTTFELWEGESYPIALLLDSPMLENPILIAGQASARAGDFWIGNYDTRVLYKLDLARSSSSGMIFGVDGISLDMPGYSAGLFTAGYETGNNAWAVPSTMRLYFSYKKPTWDYFNMVLRLTAAVGAKIEVTATYKGRQSTYTIDNTSGDATPDHYYLPLDLNSSEVVVFTSPNDFDTWGISNNGAADYGLTRDKENKRFIYDPKDYQAYCLQIGSVHYT